MSNIKPWTTAEFRAIGIAWFGGNHGWQKAMADALKINYRTVRRWASGHLIPEAQQLRIQAITGGAIALASPVRHEWLIGNGYGPDDSDGAKYEYLVHCYPPRFICRIVDVDEDGQVDDGEAEADLLSGVVYSKDFCTILCEFQWTDRQPTGEVLETLLRQAGMAIDRYNDLLIDDAD